MTNYFEAIQKLPKDLNFIFMGWGDDELKALQFAKEKNFKSNDLFGCMISRPLLLNFFDMSDVVIDQFKIGTWEQQQLKL